MWKFKEDFFPKTNHWKTNERANTKGKSISLFRRTLPLTKWLRVIFISTFSPESDALGFDDETLRIGFIWCCKFQSGVKSPGRNIIIRASCSRRKDRNYPRYAESRWLTCLNVSFQGRKEKEKACEPTYAAVFPPQRLFRLILTLIVLTPAFTPGVEEGVM